jgi:hypothetical protein
MSERGVRNLALKTGRHELTGLMIFDIANTEFIRANFTYYVSKLHQRVLQQQILSGASALVDRIRRNGEDPRDALADFWEQTRAIEAEPTPPAIGCPFLIKAGILLDDAAGWTSSRPTGPYGTASATIPSWSRSAG